MPVVVVKTVAKSTATKRATVKVTATAARVRAFLQGRDSIQNVEEQGPIPSIPGVDAAKMATNLRLLKERLSVDNLARLQDSLNSVGSNDFKEPPYDAMKAAVPTLENLGALQRLLSDPDQRSAMQTTARQFAVLLGAPDDLNSAALENTTRSRLEKRHVCRVCPQGAAVLKSSGSSAAQPCCPRRKTTTKTVSKGVVTRTIFQTVTVLPPKQTIWGRLYTDVNLNGQYDVGIDVPVVGKTVVASLAPPKKRVSSTLGSGVSGPDGKFDIEITPQPQGVQMDLSVDGQVIGTVTSSGPGGSIAAGNVRFIIVGIKETSVRLFTRLDCHGLVYL